MKTFSFLFFVALLGASCHKEETAAPSAPVTTQAIDYRDSVTGTYTCKRDSIVTFGSTTTIVHDTIQVLVTKDTTANSTVVYLNNMHPCSIADASFHYYNFSQISMDTFNTTDLRFNLRNTPDSIIFSYSYHAGLGTVGNIKYAGLKN